MYKKRRIPKPSAHDLAAWNEWLLDSDPDQQWLVEFCQRVLLGGQYVMEDGRTVQLNLLSSDQQS